jgi:hypothetical protein
MTNNLLTWDMNACWDFGTAVVRERGHSLQNQSEKELYGKKCKL